MGLGKERWSGDEAGFWSRERTVALALFLLTTLALAVCFMVLRPFLAPLAWAVAVAVAAYPAYRWLEGKLHRRGLAAGVAVLLVAGLVVTPAVRRRALARESWPSSAGPCAESSNC